MYSFTKHQQLTSESKIGGGVLVLIALFLFTVGRLDAQTLPSGFSNVTVASVYYPTGMAFAPDGRIFCTEKSGKVKIVKNGVMVGTFLQVAVDQLNERGLSSIALDPDFNTNHYVYIYYTTAGSPVRNRLSRFTANGDVVVSGSEVIILDIEPSANSIHNGGGMAFGPDGTLYVGVGNDNVNSNSQDLNNYKGKVLRINKDGSVPAGNPFSGSEPAKRIWAYGLRNPWSIDIQPGTGKIFVNDVGEGAWEEINDCTGGGENFGWPWVEGNGSNPAYDNPVYAYHHGTGLTQGCAITGGEFYNPASTNYPAQYTGKYFFTDYCNHWINYLDLSSGVVQHNFASNLSGACNAIRSSPDGDLYYFSISDNTLNKIIYSSNNAPVITSDPASISVSQGQNASFNVSASGSQPLTFKWQKNGVDIPGASSSGYSIPNVQFSDAGDYRAMVSNSYGSTTSNASTLTVTGFNAKPVATILTPVSGTLFRGDDVVSFSGSGTDAEDGTLSAAAFKWEIQFHHDIHYHPGPFVPDGVMSSSFTVSPTGEKSGNVWFRLFLTVTDSQGATDLDSLDIYPKKSKINLATLPSGLTLLFNEQPEPTNFSAQVVSGMQHDIDVVTPQTFGDSIYVFEKWLHGGSNAQVIVASDNDQAFTAVFKTQGPSSVLDPQANLPEEIVVYPNPSSGKFSFDICLEGAADNLMTLKVMNSKGQIVFAKPQEKILGCVTETVLLSDDIAAGLYLLQVDMGGMVKTARLIVSKGDR